MVINNENLCDFCFTPIAEGEACPVCGLTHDTYKTEAGILSPGVNLIGKYIIGKVLGRGGFGATYMAYSSSLGKAVAIKEYLPLNIAYRGKGEENVSIVSEEKSDTFEKGKSRFFEEAKTISLFNGNRNIVSVYEFFYANGTVYYSMEYLDGTDLKRYIDSKGGRLSEEEAVSIVKQVCNALMAVHSTQTLHRDISPDNIFVCSNGDVKLIDFGAAKQVITNDMQSYSVVVKQGFAPAEQYTKKGNQGPWTDIYAMGASFYYMIEGRVPADAIDRTENPELMFTRALKLDGIRFIISRCMAPRIADRFQNVVTLMGALEQLVSNEPVMPVANEVEEVQPAQTIQKTGNIKDEKLPGKVTRFGSRFIALVACGVAVVGILLYAVVDVALNDDISPFQGGAGGDVAQTVTSEITEEEKMSAEKKVTEEAEKKETEEVEKKETEEAEKKKAEEDRIAAEKVEAEKKAEEATEKVDEQAATAKKQDTTKKNTGTSTQKKETAPAKEAPKAPAPKSEPAKSQPSSKSISESVSEARKAAEQAAAQAAAQRAAEQAAAQAAAQRAAEQAAAQAAAQRAAEQATAQKPVEQPKQSSGSIADAARNAQGNANNNIDYKPDLTHD